MFTGEPKQQRDLLSRAGRRPGVLVNTPTQWPVGYDVRWPVALAGCVVCTLGRSAVVCSRVFFSPRLRVCPENPG